MDIVWLKNRSSVRHQKIAKSIGLNAKQVIPCSSLNGSGIVDVWRAMQAYVDTPFVPLGDLEAEAFAQNDGEY